MDYADQELWKSARRTNNYVSRQDAGIEKIIKNQPRFLELYWHANKNLILIK